MFSLSLSLPLCVCVCVCVSIPDVLSVSGQRGPIKAPAAQAPSEQGMDTWPAVSPCPLLVRRCSSSPPRLCLETRTHARDIN